MKIRINHTFLIQLLFLSLAGITAFQKISNINRKSVGKSIEVIRNRIDEFGVAEHQPAVAVEVDKPFGNTLDRLHQTGLRRFRLGIGEAEGVIAAFEVAERHFQTPGPFPNLIFKEDRGLEQTVGVALKVHSALDLIHQDLDDLL